MKKPSAIPTCNTLCLYGLNVLESASLFFFVQYIDEEFNVCMCFDVCKSTYYGYILTIFL